MNVCLTFSWSIKTVKDRTKKQNKLKLLVTAAKSASKLRKNVETMTGKIQLKFGLFPFLYIYSLICWCLPTSNRAATNSKFFCWKSQPSHINKLDEFSRLNDSPYYCHILLQFYHLHLQHTDDAQFSCQLLFAEIISTLPLSVEGKYNVLIIWNNKMEIEKHTFHLPYISGYCFPLILKKQT